MISAFVQSLCSAIGDLAPAGFVNDLIGQVCAAVVSALQNLGL